MSQQINLLLPELRPRFDWLGLPVVAAAALAALALVVAWSVAGAASAGDLAAREQALKSELAAAQLDSQTLGKAIGARQGDPQLPQKIDLARLEVSQRRQVLDLLAGDGFGADRGFSGVFQGFSRQLVKGVWLVGFGVVGADIEIRGRLTDPALLTAYVGKLNGEPAFAGRQFSALNMKGVVPAVAGDAARNAVPATATVTTPYTEFVLTTALAPSAEPKK